MMRIVNFVENCIEGPLPKGVSIDGNSVSLPDDDMFKDWGLRIEADFYRLPDGSALMHSIRDDTEEQPDYIALHRLAFAELKASHLANK